MPLSEYFRTPGYETALERYSQFAREKKWYLHDKMTLYNAAHRAFGPESRTDEARLADFQVIYDNLRGYWQVFRNAKPGTYWTAEKVYLVLSQECRDCSFTSDINLENVYGDQAKQKTVLDCLTAMRWIKPNTHYPWVAASKFMHFYNPSLFPIYDEGFIWPLVCNGAFKNDFQSFCRRHGFNPRDNSVRFNLSYTLWASDLIRKADNDFMEYFACWLGKELTALSGSVSSREATKPSNARRYYATAFECAALGAALLNTA